MVVVTNIENGGGDGGRKRGRKGKRSPPTASRAVKGPLEGEEGREGDFPPPSMESYVSGGTRRSCTTTKGEETFSWPPPSIARSHPMPCHPFGVGEREGSSFFADGGDDLVWRKGGREDGMECKLS